ncbi:hypothetical protein N8Z39_01950 [Cyclobacteriaceae bacterium]|nr:hypothetical protein [Cyclobacteriaceae bacterium]
MKLKVDVFLLMGLIFLTLVVLCFLIITPEVTYYQTVHSEFNSLMISGKTANNHSSYGFIFCFGMIWVYLGSLLLSTRHLKKQKRRNIQIVMVCFCLVYLCLLGLLVFLNDLNLQSFYFGFPRSTAVMLYLIGFSPLSLSYIYIRYFEAIIITEASFKSFQNLIKSQDK